MKKLLTYLPLVLFAALLPIMILRDFTPSNELRYLSIADEAIEQGHIFAFTNQGEAYADKPPLYLWIVMLGKVIFGSHQMWFLSLFSFIPAMVIMCIMNRWVCPVLDLQDRTAAALMLSTCGLFSGLAIFLRMDMLMCMFIILSLYIFWRMYSGECDRPAARILFPVSVFLALFTKGPVGVLVPLVSTLAFLLVKGKIKTIGRYWGWRTWGILTGCCALWFVAVWMEGGAEYLDNLLFHQTIDRAIDAFHHKEPIYYYLISIWYSIAPWSLLAIGIIVAAAAKRMKFSDLEQFFLTVILSTFVLLSAFSSKIAVYLAPTFPFFIYLAALLMARMRPNIWMKIAVAIPALIWICTPAAIVLAHRVPEMAVLQNGWCIAATVILSLSGIVALLLLRRPAPRTAIDTLACGLLAALFVGGFSLPQINTELGYGTLCKTARKIATENSCSGYYVCGISRPEAMDVYLGEDIRKVSTDEIVAGECDEGILMISQRKIDKDPALQLYIAEKEQIRIGSNLIVRISQSQ